MRPTIILNGELASTDVAADDATLRTFVGVALISVYGTDVRESEYETRRESGELVEMVRPDGWPFKMNDYGMRDGETLYVTRRVGVGA